MSGNIENLTLTGSANINGTGNADNNIILGNSGANTLSGGAGNDTLNGGLGADTMAGGVGDDTYVVESSGDVVVEAANAGTDSVQSGISYALTDNVENLTLTGTANLSGTGNALNNILTGNGGNNALNGGAGADTMVGGAGDDSYSVDNAGDVVTENLDEGIDHVQASVTYALSANVENLTLTGAGNLNGTGNTLDNVITGNSGNNTISGLDGSDILIGNVGNDTLDGGAGVDSMSGGLGNDTYVVDSVDDLVIETAGEGNDTVQASFSYTLADNLENLTLTGSDALDGTGNSSANTISGNSGGNILSGLAGDDTLIGNQDADLLDGGTGADAMAGGAGDDNYIVDNAGDVVVESGSEGSDTVQSSINYALTANVENLILSGAGNLTGTGNALNNTITGTESDNILDGGAGADTLAGGTGDDTYVVDDIADVVVEGFNAGMDTVLASANYALSDNVENLTLTGTGNVNGTGNALDNLITGNNGANVLAGLAGNDTYIVQNSDDIVLENADDGLDTVQSSATYTLSENVENLVLTGTDNLSGTGNALNNTITGTAGANVLDGSAGADSLAGGAGNDTYIVDDAGDLVTEATGEGTDTVHASIDYALGAALENLVLAGGAIAGTGNELDNVLTANNLGNTLSGEAGNDVLLGGSGNDVLDGGDGADTMIGTIGNDTYVVSGVGDVVVEAAGEGSDTVHASIDYTLTSGVENLVLLGSATQGTGNSLANSITGNDSGNRLSGGAGNDSLFGGSGNDVLDGGSDADAMNGGAGNDTYTVDNASDQVVEGAGEGTDAVNASVNYILAANVENLTLSGAAVVGTGNVLDNILIANDLGNILSGDAGNDSLLGGSGNDVLDGGTGTDTMSGGIGNDTYMVDIADDQVLESTGEGNDTVISSANYTLAANVENLILTGAATQGAGNDQDNTITANDLGNTLFGDVGNDTLVGGAANDVLDGGSGSDTLLGGAGDDIYTVDDSGDQVVEAADAGSDTVHASIDYSLTANVENLVLTGGATLGVGNALDNTITGNNSLGSFLAGDAGDDTLNGGAGDDVLDGGTGADAMSGNGGNDSYVVDNAGDVVVESVDAGTDHVEASVSYTLTANVENLTLTGAANTDGTGNDQDNVLTGNVGDNILDGGAGADVMNAGAGNDTYVVDNVGDQVIETLFGGTDTGRSSISYVLADQVENLTLTGTGDLTGTGNAQDNVLEGNSGNNTLDGAAGADTMVGAAGNDTYVVESFGDVVFEAANEGNDTIQSSVSYTLSENVENLTLTGTSDLLATGNELNNTLIGNAGSNTLDGRAGNDTLTGGAGIDNLLGGDGNDILTGGTGNDFLLGGAGNDSYVYSAGDGLDQLTDAAGTDTLRFGVGLTREDIALRIVTVNGQKIAQVRVLNGGGCEQEDQGVDFLVTIASNGQIVSPIENFVFENGQQFVLNDLLIKQTSFWGTSRNDVLIGDHNDNFMSGGNGDDKMYGGSGNDTLDGGNGVDLLYGGGGADKLYGGNQADTLYGECGDDFLEGRNGADKLYGGGGNDVLYGGNDNDILDGGEGDDVLVGDNGADLLYGGAGADTLDGGSGENYINAGAGDDQIWIGNGRDVVQAGSGDDSINTEAYCYGGNNSLIDAGEGNDNIGTGWGRDWIAGSKGNDTIDAGSGSNLFAFNRGDGADVIHGGNWASDTISIGKGIRYSDLTLARTGTDLVLGMGEGESITLKDWYLGNDHKNVDRLQMVTIAGGDYLANSADKTRNNYVESFDFGKLVQRFDQAQANAPTINQWAVMNGLLEAHLSGSNSAAIGGDLSYQYAVTGSLAGIGLNAAQDSLSSSNFYGSSPQTLHSRSQLEQGAIKLS